MKAFKSNKHVTTQPTKLPFISFTSSLSDHHNYKHFLKSMKLHQFGSMPQRVGTKVLDHTSFKLTSEAHSRLNSFLKNHKVSDKIAGHLYHVSNFLHTGNESVSYCNVSRSITVSKENTYLTHFQYGKPTSSRLFNKNKYFDSIIRKKIDVFNTEKDYQKITKRKYLTIVGGANQKNYSIILY